MPTETIIIFAFFILALSQLLMVLFFWWQERRGESVKGKGESSQEDNKSWDILHSAIKKSQAIIGNAELAEVKIAADTKYRTSQLEKQYSDKLQLTVQEIQQAFLAEIAKASTAYKQYLSDLSTRAEQTQGKLDTQVQEQVSKLFLGFEHELSSGLKELEKKSLAETQLQVQAANLAIDQYRQMRLEQIDKDILTIIERATAIVLGKKLTLDDQIDLVNQALEQAKKEKFL